MDYIKVGFITKPHGIKGELKVEPLTDSLERFRGMKKIYIQKNDKYSEESVEGVKVLNGFIVMKLKNFNRIEESEHLRNKYIFVERNNAVSLEPGEYYTQDLIGCSFWFNDKLLGTIEDLVNEGTCDIFVVNSNGNEVLYPFLKELINEIDLVNKKVFVKSIEGYFD